MAQVVKKIPKGYQMGTTTIRAIPEGFKLEGDPVDLNVDKVDGLDLPNSIANILTDHNATNHPVSVLKFATGSYSELIPPNSDGTLFTTNAYAHQVQMKGTDSNIWVGKTVSSNFWGYAVTTSYVQFKWQMCNKHISVSKTAYANWYYHSSSKQGIWGIWDLDKKKLVCVLVEQDDETGGRLDKPTALSQLLVKFKEPQKFLTEDYDKDIDLVKDKNEKQKLLKEKNRAGFILEHTKVIEEDFEELKEGAEK